MIKSIPLMNLQNAEYQAFIFDVLKLINDTNIDNLTAIKDKMRPMSDKLDVAVMQVRKSEHTKNITKMDKIRDDYFRGLFLRVKSDNLSPNAEIKTYAYKLKILLEHYKNIPKENLRVATKMIDSMIADLRSQDYQTAVEKLGIEAWIVALEKSNQDFSSVYDTRRDEIASNQTINVRELRKQIDEQYRILVKTLEALQVLNPSKDTELIIAKLNTTIDKWKDIIAIRKSTNKKDSKTEKPVIDGIPMPPLPPVVDYVEVDN